jgi:acetyl esterase
MTTVRYEGIIQDFVMVNAMRGTNAAEDAITQAINHLGDALGTDVYLRASRPA